MIFDFPRIWYLGGAPGQSPVSKWAVPTGAIATLCVKKPFDKVRQALAPWTNKGCTVTLREPTEGWGMKWNLVVTLPKSEALSPRAPISEKIL